MLNDLLTFNKFVAPTLIKIVYWIGIVGIILGVLTTLAGAAGMLQYDGASGLGMLVAALVGGAAAILLWRVLCEVWIVIFSINDRLGTLVERGNKV